MKKGIIVLLILVITVCFICGCATQLPQKTVITPIPQTEFKENEPASNGNLRITVIQHAVHALGTKDLFGTHDLGLETYLVLKLENLRSDRTFHILSSDFSLYDNNGIMVSNAGTFGGKDSKKFDLQPGDREEVNLRFHFPTGTEMSGYNKLKFDFSGSGSSGKIVYFNL